MNKARLNLYLSKDEHEVIKKGALAMGQSKNAFAIDRIMLSFKLEAENDKLEAIIEKLTESKQ